MSCQTMSSAKRRKVKDEAAPKETFRCEEDVQRALFQNEVCCYVTGDLDNQSCMADHGCR